MTNKLSSHDYKSLRELYITQEMSISKIAKSIGCSYEPLRRKLHRLNIPLRPKHLVYAKGKKHNITKEALEREYIENNKTQAETAEFFECGSTLIYNLLKKHGVPVRSRSQVLSGRKFTLEHKIKLAQAKKGKHIGSKNPNWKDGVSTDHAVIRRNFAYVTFRKHVLRIKGNFCHNCGTNLLEKCPCCSHKSDRHVHHIKDFSAHRDLRLSLDNAIVLCESCHLSQHRKKATKVNR